MRVHLALQCLSKNVPVGVHTPAPVSKNGYVLPAPNRQVSEHSDPAVPQLPVRIATNTRITERQDNR
jgi:hypothetical protein